MYPKLPECSAGLQLGTSESEKQSLPRLLHRFTCTCSFFISYHPTLHHQLAASNLPSSSEEDHVVGVREWLDQKYLPLLVCCSVAFSTRNSSAHHAIANQVSSLVAGYKALEQRGTILAYFRDQLDKGQKHCTLSITEQRARLLVTVLLGIWPHVSLEDQHKCLAAHTTCTCIHVISIQRLHAPHLISHVVLFGTSWYSSDQLCGVVWYIMLFI